MRQTSIGRCSKGRLELGRAVRAYGQALRRPQGSEHHLGRTQGGTTHRLLPDREAAWPRGVAAAWLSHRLFSGEGARRLRRLDARGGDSRRISGRRGRKIEMPSPRARCEQRERTMGHEAGTSRKRESTHLPGQGRQAVRRRGCHRYVGRLRPALNLAAGLKACAPRAGR
jgi:hypothetical protein